MQHLTFKETPTASPLAFIQGGKNDGKVIFIEDNNATNASAGGKLSAEDTIMPDSYDWTPFLKKFKPKERAIISARLNKCLLLDREPEDDISDIYNSVRKSPALGTRLDLSDGGSMQVIPMTDLPRTVCFTFGQSGSGKTYWTFNFARQYQKLFPKNPIYLFSRLESDDTLDKLKGLKRVKIDETIGEAGLSATDFPNSLVLFDDIDSLPKTMKEPVYHILRDILEVGRHHKTSVCVTAHLGANHGDTRTILNEAHILTCFPGGSSPKAIRYVLSTYGGLENNDINRLMKIGSRWISVRRHFPGAVVYQHGCYLSNATE